MDNERYEAGLKVRKAVLGDVYVDQAINNATDFNRPFQELVTEFCWGTCWTDEALSRKQRSLLNLGMLAASGRMEEFELHFAGALRNGLTVEELRAALIQIAVYCGIPAGVECFRIARRVMAAEAAESAKPA
jgi:4-carboxymuconolactone decarboxylase